MQFTFPQLFLSFLVNGYHLCSYALKYNLVKSLSSYLKGICVLLCFLEMLMVSCTVEIHEHTVSIKSMLSDQIKLGPQFKTF